MLGNLAFLETFKLLTGIVVGVVTALITKFTKEVLLLLGHIPFFYYLSPYKNSPLFSYSKVRVVEPLAVLSCAYLSYMLAELVSFSGGLIFLPF